MSIYKRGNIWWCNFTVRGKRTQCTTGQTDERKARAWERDKISELSGESSAKVALEKVKQLLVDNTATFEQAWGYFEKYPRAKSTPRQQKINRHAWSDFSSFAAHLGIDSVFSVDHDLAAKYTSHLKENGKFSPIVYTRGKKTITNERGLKPLSAQSINFYIGTLRLIFNILKIGRFVIENPFENIQKIPSNAVDREIFAESELQSLSKFKDDPLFPIIVVGCYTGLRLVDIVALQHQHVNLANHWIEKIQSKTGNIVSMPIIDPLYNYLLSLPDGAPDHYLFPQLKAQYDADSSSISKAFKRLLAKAGISGATKRVEGRSRVSSVKDIHSLRHTFAYTAGKYGIPLSIVQSVLGHMTPAMTRHYMAHATAMDKQQGMSAMPDLLGDGKKKSGDSEALALVKSMTAKNWKQTQSKLLDLLLKNPTSQ